MSAFFFNSKFQNAKITLRIFGLIWNFYEICVIILLNQKIITLNCTFILFSAIFLLWSITKLPNYTFSKVTIPFQLLIQKILWIQNCILSMITRNFLLPSQLSSNSNTESQNHASPHLVKTCGLEAFQIPQHQWEDISRILELVLFHGRHLIPCQRIYQFQFLHMFPLHLLDLALLDCTYHCRRDLI